ncbi:MAG: tRNA (adenosine(37)-N6)-threonylcarbamoyltransferase complex dimerization subunit type 1 TsaB [Chitinophagales bacterium]
MSLILCIETATKTCSVALAKDGKCIANIEEHDIQSHAGKLTEFIQEAMRLTSYKMSDLNAIAISIGPGSYTGLRIGLSAAKGLCYSLDIPLISINTLQGLAAGMIKEDDKQDIYIPCFDARRDEIYYAVYDKNLQEIEPAQPHILSENSFFNYSNKNTLIAGSGTDKTLKAINIPNKFKKNFSIITTKNLVEISENLYKKSIFADVAYIEPQYLKPFIGTKPKQHI